LSQAADDFDAIFYLAGFVRSYDQGKIKKERKKER